MHVAWTLGQVVGAMMSVVRGPVDVLWRPSICCKSTFSMAGRVGRFVPLLKTCSRACGGRVSSSTAGELSLYDGIISRGGSEASACQASGSSTSGVMGQWRAMGLHRHYSSDSGSKDASAIGNEKVQQLANDILKLTVLESSQLTEILRSKLGLQKPAYGAMPVFAAGAAPASGGAAPGAAAGAAPKEEKKAEKTTFEVKLESFSADGKIKVIKEIRAIASLGLKEAKELVEKAPVVIKADVPKADAEAIKKQIEAAGGKVSLA